MRLAKFKKGKADLESFYKINIEIGFILILLVLIVLFNVRIQFNSKTEFAPPPQETVKMEDVVQTKQADTPPPPPPPQISVAVSNDAVIADEPIGLNTELNLDSPLSLPSKPPEMKDTTDNDNTNNEVFVIVERMPELIGGIENLQKNIVYPDIARQAGIEGRVYVQFIIDEHGNIHNPIVVRGIGGGCDEAAIAAVKKAHFKPGLQRGRPVKVRYTMPIVFKLKKN